GIVGDIALRFFDINGKKVDNFLNSRLIGLTLEEIKTIPHQRLRTMDGQVLR
ncbi:unnamed protein product, partial [marine sediment metagenome]